MKNLVTKAIVFSGFFLIAACNQQSGSSSPSPLNSESSSSSSSGSSSKMSAVSFRLVDAPNKELKSVVVNIDHLEVVIAGQGKAGRLILAQDLGPVDLLQLQNGISLPLQDIVAPEGLRIQQIRLILKEVGHYAVKDDDSICELKTPSAQKTGVKIILTNKVQFEGDNQYNVVVDFDAKKSVVQQGNGGCLLKPVLKLKSVTKQLISIPEEPVEIITTPDENDPSADDGWDYTPIIDGQEPIVDESQLSDLL